MSSIVFGTIAEIDERLWDVAPYYGDMDDWWLAQTGFTHKYSPYGENGEFNSIPEEINEYIRDRGNWLRANPCPAKIFTEWNSGVVIIAVPSIDIFDNYKGVESFSLDDLTVSNDEYTAYINFCLKYIFDSEEEINPTYFLIDTE